MRLTYTERPPSWDVASLRFALVAALVAGPILLGPVQAGAQAVGQLVVGHVDLRDRNGRWREDVLASVRLPDGRSIPVETAGASRARLTRLVDGPVSLSASQLQQRALTVDAVIAGALPRRPALMASSTAPRFYIIPCQFSTGNAIDTAFYQASLASVFPGADALISQSSRNASSIAGSVVGSPVSLTRPVTYYFQNLGTNVGTGPFTDGVARDAAFINDCLDAAAAAGRPIDLTQYDGIGVQVNLRLAGAWAYRALPLVRGGTTYARRALILSNFAEAGVYAHEIGHTYGFRHLMARQLYAYQAYWSTMSASDFPLRAGVQTFGSLFSAVERSQAGWNSARLRRIAPGASATVSLTYPSVAPVAGDADAVLVEIAAPGGTDSLFIEARRPVSGTFEHVIPGDAVVMYLVSGGVVNVIDADDTESPNDAGAQWLVGERYVGGGVTVTVRERSATGFLIDVTTRSGVRVVADTVRRVHAGFPVRDSILVVGASGTVSYSVRGLPAGLTFDPNTRRITGTPTANGSAWLIAEDAAGRDSLPYRIERTTGPWIGAARTFVLGATVRDTLAIFGWTRQGYQSNEFWTVSGVPPGLSVTGFSDNGVDKIVVNGQPTSVGTTTTTISVRQFGQTISQPFTMQVVRDPLRITGDTLRSYQHGYAVRDTLRSTGGDGTPVSWRIRSGSLPAGLQLVDGVIAGSAEQAGDARIEIEAVQGGTATAQWFRLRTAPSLVLAAADSVRPAAVFGTTYADTLRATTVGGVTAVWRATGLPRGLVLSPTGAIGGVPDSAGTFRITATVSAAYPARTLTRELQLVLTVQPPVFSTEQMIDQLLLGGSALSSAAMRYLDQLGNGNGRLDVGDVLRYFRRP